MSADSLKPCPCGRSDEGAQAPIWNRGEWRIECACGWAGPKADTPLEAANRWNERESSPSADPVGYLTAESRHSLRNWGGNGSRGTVPLHAARSSVASIAVHLALPRPDLSQLKSELAALDYKSEHSAEHRKGFELAREAARALVARFDRSTS